VRSTRNRNDQISGSIVYEATLALAKMRTYCNQARVVHLPLLGFSLEWSPERRAELRDAWMRWRNIYDILQPMETMSDSLSPDSREVMLPARWWNSRADQRTVDALQTNLAGTLATFLNDVAYPIRDAKIRIEPLHFDTDAQKISNVSRLVLDLIEPRGQGLVDRASTTVVRLRETVLRNRAGLPWGVAAA